MVQGYTSQSSSHPGRWCSSDAGGSIQSGDHNRIFETTGSQDHDRYPHDQWSAHLTLGNELQPIQDIDCKSGDAMLSVTGLNKFYFLRDFHDNAMQITIRSTYVELNNNRGGTKGK